MCHKIYSFMDFQRQEIIYHNKSGSYEAVDSNNNYQANNNNNNNNNSSSSSSHFDKLDFNDLPEDFSFSLLDAIDDDHDHNADHNAADDADTHIYNLHQVSYWLWLDIVTY